MRTIIVAEYLALDGVMEAPQWTGPYFNEELARFQRDRLFASDALLLGRVTYEGFAASWPAMTDEEGFAERMNGLPKFVASRTLRAIQWNAAPLEGEVADAVADLKRQPGRDLLIYASADLVGTLRRHDLVDEYRLMVFPVVRGGGKRLFADGGAAGTLQLVEARTTRTGVALLTYRPAGR